MSELAHLGPVELFTPKGEESLRFFTDVMGMFVSHQEGNSTYLRCWADYQPWSLKLTESHTSGMGVLGLRAWSPEALQRRVAAVEATGLGEGWTDGDLARGPSYRFRDPDGHVFELYYECERYDPPEHLKPALKNVPGRYTGNGCAVKRLDHDIWLDAGIHIEAAPSKHAIAQGFFLYGLEPGGNRVEVTSGGRFVYDPEEPVVVWTEEERAKGQAWGVKTVESFHTYGTPPVG